MSNVVLNWLNSVYLWDISIGIKGIDWLFRLKYSYHLGLLDRLFRKEKKEEGPIDIRFGRYSDAYKETEQYDLWDQSLALFEQQSYLDAYERFLQYLTDPTEENIKYDRSDDLLTFEIIQGSKKLTGHSNNHKIRVETKIAKVTQQPLKQSLTTAGKALVEADKKADPTLPKTKNSQLY